eukprot:GHRR01026556.1.p1 GENE.GHRR01026556.1~~GHRR01026556.1.p1  ORF type:complete len:305 (+),score=81.79 GHRR01026556.1:33-917(+)
MATGNSITSRVHARVGLLGNPSDGFFGKTISFSLGNFYAEVTLSPQDSVAFEPHPEHDCCHYESLEALANKVATQGYYGGIRLLMAICKRFHEHCTQQQYQLPSRGFSMRYTTNIPRQAGLSGSSALVCAGLNCLLQYYQVPALVLPVEQRPSLVLSAEADLGITAGLQDRVIQVYGGLVYMDFDCQHMEVHGSGRVALRQGDTDLLALLMNTNFDLRREMFGDAALGETNLSMVAIARSVGAAAKFTGSGGAVVALCPKGQEQEQQLQDACAAAGFQCVLVQVAPAIYQAKPS